MKNRSLIIPHLALILSMLAWSSSFIAIKVALSAYSPMVVMAGRMLTASIVCLPVLGQVLRSLQDPFIRKVMLISVLCEPCFYFLFETFALRNTTSGQAGMIIALLPLSVAIVARFALKDRLPGRMWAGFFLAIAGVVWLTLASKSSQSAPNPLLGNLLEVMAVLCATGYTVAAKKLFSRIAPNILTASMSFCGLCFFGPLAVLPLPLNPIEIEVGVASWLPLACIIYLGTIVTFAGYGLYNYGISCVSVGQAAAYTNLIPVVTLIMGVFWLNESVLPVQYMASGLVVFGVALSQSGIGGSLTKRKKARR